MFLPSAIHLPLIFLLKYLPRRLEEPWSHHHQITRSEIFF
jgi:hypothetical protein